jgi:hypothetical protein
VTNEIYYKEKHSLNLKKKTQNNKVNSNLFETLIVLVLIKNEILILFFKSKKIIFHIWN